LQIYKISRIQQPKTKLYFFQRLCSGFAVALVMLGCFYVPAFLHILSLIAVADWMQSGCNPNAMKML